MTTVLDLPSAAVGTQLCANRQLNEEFSCSTTHSELFRWSAPPDLGAGQNVPVEIIAFFMQYGETWAEMESSTPVFVNPTGAKQSNGNYQSDVSGRFACVWIQTAAGFSTKSADELSEPCTGKLSVSSVIFQEGTKARSWAVVGDVYVTVTFEISIGR